MTRSGRPGASASETRVVLLSGWAWAYTLPRGPPPQSVPRRLSLGRGFPGGMSDLCDTGWDFPIVLPFSLELERLGPFGK